MARCVVEVLVARQEHEVVGGDRCRLGVEHDRELALVRRDDRLVGDAGGQAVRRRGVELPGLGFGALDRRTVGSVRCRRSRNLWRNRSIVANPRRLSLAAPQAAPTRATTASAATSVRRAVNVTPVFRCRGRPIGVVSTGDRSTWTASYDRVDQGGCGVVVADEVARDPSEQEHRGDGSDTDGDESEGLAAAGLLLHLLLLLRTVGLLTFTFFGSHRSRRLSARRTLAELQGDRPG